MPPLALCLVPWVLILAAVLLWFPRWSPCWLGFRDRLGLLLVLTAVAVSYYILHAHVGSQ